VQRFIQGQQVRFVELSFCQEVAQRLAQDKRSPLLVSQGGCFRVAYCLGNYTINTSPDKFQVVWRVRNISQEQAESLQRAMVRKFGGDPAATDSTRVLRLPGFLNRKYEAEFLVRAVKHADHVYQPQDFHFRTEFIETDFRPHRQSPTFVSTQPRQLSQSEHDWAYAKRTLARGDDPEEVIRRIADFRAGEKHDPLDYARRTVTKAQADLQNRSVWTAASEETGFESERPSAR